MAIWGIGAYYDRDVSDNFVEQEVACVGWNSTEAPALHAELRSMAIGDLVYIKSFTPKHGLIIKAVGIIVSDEVRDRPGLGQGVAVRWLSTVTTEYGRVQEKLNVRSNTLYREYNQEIQKQILNVIMEAFQLETL